MNLSEQKKTLPREAPGTVMVPSDAFVSEMEDRPRDAVVLGLRLLGAKEKQSIIRLAQADFRKRENIESTDPDEARALLVMRYYVASVICDPNDIEEPSSLFEFPHRHVFLRLTESGCRFIMDAALKLEVEVSPRYPQASPEELEELATRIQDGELEALSNADRAAALRHIMFALEVLREAGSHKSISELAAEEFAEGLQTT